MVAINGNTVEFRFFRPQAQHVCLVGDFNGWNQDALPMDLTPGGYWVTRLDLPAGTFSFRYFADGQWFTDFAAFGLENGPYGLNSVLRIEPCAPPSPISVDVGTGQTNARWFQESKAEILVKTAS